MSGLQPLLEWLPPFLLLLTRLSGMFILSPILASSGVPRQVRAFLAVGLAAICFPVVAVGPEAPLAGLRGAEFSLFALAPLMGLELAVGYVLGYVAMLPLAGAQAAGLVIGQQMGLQLGGVFNPELQDDSGVLGQFLYLLALVVFLALGGHHLLIQVLVGSFEHVPPGGMTDFGAVMEVIVGLLQAMIELVVQVSMPVLAVLFLESVAMGFIARTVPQMNILSVGFVTRILMSTAVVAVSLATIARLTDGSFRHAFEGAHRIFLGG
ncbi:flagellar biosynthetic protein FliR [Phycisphaera mikurensis]|uniref:Putative flagellar biosynthetic protein FliR n=1 Tax=Phycisphaera mikurensis (strain NBRC 102666 / KCTC 22515 / FYK2301M01) TaxID=1142394 RepID=I0IGX1_PHYMF|nr:flagellar biosynthetic protein FliR [Phycisphaera mikurensis]MBB6440766.1 flagellar biosynthetic protein FliR [Phycisphaera mikurensis]BAM04509.1 putative flagellar biosynthetic protein FliR [Phycisphaera mikurensis NBRC 102666]